LNRCLRRTALSLAAAAAATVLAVLSSPPPAAAEDVVLEHLGLAFVARLELPPGKSLDEGPVALIVHGTLAHHAAEPVRGLQAGLQRRGIASLAVTLSLGLDARRGMFDCTLEHAHRASDAVDEIAAWIAWLEARGAGSIVLAGHSGGAQQVALFASVDPIAAVKKVVLVAPPVDTLDVAASRYRKSYGANLADLIQRAEKLVADGEEDALIDAAGFLTCKSARVAAASVLDYYDPGQKRTAIGLLDEINRPVLVAAAGADDVAPDVPRHVAAANPGAHVSTIVIDGADHAFRGRHMDLLADGVAGFIRR
jgi:pimeloyl-ACP methyl ester carboxylesterase